MRDEDIIKDMEFKEVFGRSAREYAGHSRGLYRILRNEKEITLMTNEDIAYVIALCAFETGFKHAMRSMIKGMGTNNLDRCRGKYIPDTVEGEKEQEEAVDRFYERCAELSDRITEKYFQDEKGRKNPFREIIRLRESKRTKTEE